MAPIDHDGSSDDLAVQIGQEIVKARNAAGLSVAELHRRTGISRTVIQGYERGRYKPGASELKRLAEVLECSPNRLLFGRDSFKQPSALDQFLGGEAGTADAAFESSKAGLLIACLSPEERQAVMTLAVRLVESRGGSEAVRAILAIQSEVEGSLRDEAGMGGKFTQLVEQNSKELVDRASSRVEAEARSAKKGGRAKR